MATRAEEVAALPGAGELVLRGGTCLHKLHLSEPFRYSEDLDYVRRTHSGIKPYVDALRSIAGDVGLEVSSVNTRGSRNAGHRGSA